MKTGKRIAALVCAVLLLALLLACDSLAFAEAAETPVSIPQLEDFAGEYIGKFISFGENMIPLDEKDYYTLTIEGDEAIISEGIVTGTNGPDTMTIKLVYENGELYWQPDDSDVKVFTLRMLEDGTVTITFEVNPDIPVFHFELVQQAKE